MEFHFLGRSVPRNTVQRMLLETMEGTSALEVEDEFEKKKDYQGDGAGND